MIDQVVHRPGRRHAPIHGIHIEHDAPLPILHSDIPLNANGLRQARQAAVIGLGQQVCLRKGQVCKLLLRIDAILRRRHGGQLAQRTVRRRPLRHAQRDHRRCQHRQGGQKQLPRKVQGNAQRKRQPQIAEQPYQRAMY